MPLADKQPCQHTKTTLVQHQDIEYGWFAARQCDLCGAITQEPVTADDLDEASNAPWLDEDSYYTRTEERLDDDAGLLAVTFMWRALK